MALVLGTFGEELTLKIRQGATLGPFTASVKNPDGSPVDLTGSIIRGQIRKRANDTEVVATLTITIDPGTGGTYSITMPWSETAALACGDSINASASQYVHDIEWQDASGKVLPLYYGKVLVFREVTR
jgi:hypothetical protein